MTGLAIVLALVLVAIFAPLFANHTAAFTQTLADRLQEMSWAHPFGTDELGRDIFARIIFGSRITLTIVVLVSVIVVPVGLGIGLPAGYFGGWIDAVLMRITDIFLAFPRLVLALAFAAALGPGIENAVIAISLDRVAALCPARARGDADAAHAEFIEAAELQGASHLRILFTQIMPLCLPSVIIRLTLDMAGIILTAAGLGFLGLGAQPPRPNGAPWSPPAGSCCWTSGGSRPSRASRSSLSASASTCWATACATWRIPAPDERCPAADRAQSARDLSERRRRLPCGAQRVLHARPRAAGHRRRVPARANRPPAAPSWG